MRKFIYIFQYSVLCSLLVGCSSSYGFYYSKPTDDKSYRFYPNGIVLVELEGISLFLKPDNEISFHDGTEAPFIPIPIGKDSPEKFYHSEKYFDIEVVLQSKKDSFVFNPKELYLILEDESILEASQYLVKKIPTRAPSSKVPHNLVHNNPGDKDPYWKKEEKIWVDNQYFNLMKDGSLWGIGFVLRFDTGTPKPGTLFTIKIKGLKYFDQKIEIPTIRFEDKARYTWTHN